MTTVSSPPGSRAVQRGGFLVASSLVDRLRAKWANPAGVAVWSVMAMTPFRFAACPYLLAPTSIQITMPARVLAEPAQ